MSTQRGQRQEAGDPVERFGALELLLGARATQSYEDVFYLKDRKKNPYRAKIWPPKRMVWFLACSLAGSQQKCALARRPSSSKLAAPAAAGIA